jgi:hypothetical protein
MNGPSTVAEARTNNIASDRKEFDGGSLSSLKVGKSSRDTLRFDYRFLGKKYTELKSVETQSELALETEARTTDFIEIGCLKGNAIGINDFRTRWVSTELGNNAFAHCGVGEHSREIPQVELELVVTQNENDVSLILAFSNSIPSLFNPAKYANTGHEKLPPDYHQGHMGLTSLIGMVKPGTFLTYRWDTASSEVITCKMSYFEENDPDRPELPEETATPAIRLTVTKCNNRGSDLPYSTEQFLQDVATGLPTTRVTVTAIIGRDEPVSGGEADSTDCSGTNNEAP